MGRCTMHVEEAVVSVHVQVVPRVHKVQPVVIPVKFTFTVPTLL
jgi:hypothetical protein